MAGTSKSQDSAFKLPRALRGIPHIEELAPSVQKSLVEYVNLATKRSNFHPKKTSESVETVKPQQENPSPEIMASKTVEGTESPTQNSNPFAGSSFHPKTSETVETAIALTPPAKPTANTRKGRSTRKSNMTEAEKMARWPRVDNLPSVEPTDKEVIAIARSRKPKDQGNMPLGIWRHTKAPHAFGYRGRLLEKYYHICDRQADGTFLLEEGYQKKLVNNYPAFRKSRDASNIYTTKGPRQASPRLIKNRRDEKGKFRKALASEQGKELTQYGVEKTLLHTYDVNKGSKAWLAGADKHQKSRLSKVRERATEVQMDAVRERIKMREEGAILGRKLQDVQQQIAKTEEMEETLKIEKEKFERERAAFWVAKGGNVGTGGEVGNVTTVGKVGIGGEVEEDPDEVIPLSFELFEDDDD